MYLSEHEGLVFEHGAYGPNRVIDFGLHIPNPYCVLSCSVLSILAARAIPVRRTLVVVDVASAQIPLALFTNSWHAFENEICTP